MGPWTHWIAGLDRLWVSSRFSGRLWIKMEGRERAIKENIDLWPPHEHTRGGGAEKKMARC